MNSPPNSKALEQSRIKLQSYQVSTEKVNLQYQLLFFSSFFVLFFLKKKAKLVLMQEKINYPNHGQGDK